MKLFGNKSRAGKQLHFDLWKSSQRSLFGGELCRAHAKEKRPISTKWCMHVVLRSSLATGQHSFLKQGRDAQVHRIISRQAKQSGVKIYRYANSGNHLHLLIRPGHRIAYNRFIRAVTGLIARAVLGAKRGMPQFLRFWDFRPFSRIVSWGRDFKAVSSYLMQNTAEALALIPYKPRKTTCRLSRAGP